MAATIHTRQGSNAILPPAIAHRLEQTLAQHAHWDACSRTDAKPEVVHALNAGASNFSMLVAAAQRQWVVRIDGIKPSQHGLNRQSEWRILQDAAAARLGPTPRYFNPELGSLVYDYLPADRSQHYSTELLAKLLRGIHRLPARRHRINLRERIGIYENRADKLNSDLAREVLAQRERIALLLTALDRTAANTVLCHNDLLQGNRLVSGGTLWALDWEYAAMASPWFELAVISVGDALSNGERSALVTAYLQREPSAQEHVELEMYMALYRYLELLWYITLERRVLSAEQYEQKLSALLASTRQTL